MKDRELMQEWRSMSYEAVLERAENELAELRSKLSGIESSRGDMKLAKLYDELMSIRHQALQIKYAAYIGEDGRSPYQGHGPPPELVRIEHIAADVCDEAARINNECPDFPQFVRGTTGMLVLAGVTEEGSVLARDTGNGDVFLLDSLGLDRGLDELQRDLEE